MTIKADRKQSIAKLLGGNAKAMADKAKAMVDNRKQWLLLDSNDRLPQHKADVQSQSIK